MSDATLRAAIKARIEALGASIGRVHDYERWCANPAQFLALFQDAATSKIFGWEIVRTGFSVRRVTMSRWKMIHQYTVRGYYGLQDAAATEKTVNALADLIALDFTRTPIAGTIGEQLPEAEVETRMFGSVLCHVVAIRLPQVAEMVAQLPDEDVDLLRIGLNYYLQDPVDDDVVDATDLVELGEEV